MKANKEIVIEINGKKYFSSTEDLENSIPYKIIEKLCVLNKVPTENLKDHIITIAKKNTVCE